MTDNEARYRNALAKICHLASGTLLDDELDRPEETGEEARDVSPSCVLKSLPDDLLIEAADVAAAINPLNSPPAALMALDPSADRMRIAVLTQKYWGAKPRQLTVSFMESTPSDLRRRILTHLNAWTKTGGVGFVETAGTGEVRISRGPGGYWSYLGTDILLIAAGQPTMNLERFTMQTPEAEYERVVQHEAGHTLGFPHEHMRKALVARIDPRKAYDYFLRTYGWDKRTVDQQVLTPLDERSLIGTPADQTSIMCYQLPGSITRDGKPITGGPRINRTDYDFAGRVYPKAARLARAEREAGDETHDEAVAASV